MAVKTFHGCSTSEDVKLWVKNFIFSALEKIKYVV